MVCYIPLFKVLFLLITLLICSAFLRSPRSSTVQRSLFSSDLLVDNVVDSELFFRPLQSDDYERGISITFSHQRTTPNFWFHSPLSPRLSLLVFPSSSPYSPITPTFSPSHTKLDQGFCELLGQLTVSDFSKAKFDERFKEMEKAGDMYHSTCVLLLPLFFSEFVSFFSSTFIFVSLY